MLRIVVLIHDVTSWQAQQDSIHQQKTGRNLESSCNGVPKDYPAYAISY